MANDPIGPPCVPRNWRYNSQNDGHKFRDSPEAVRTPSTPVLREAVFFRSFSKYAGVRFELQTSNQHLISIGGNLRFTFHVQDDSSAKFISKQCYPLVTTCRRQSIGRRCIVVSDVFSSTFPCSIRMLMACAVTRILEIHNGEY
jgi:hypothetical protein